jgi:hypothetical protein
MRRILRIALTAFAAGTAIAALLAAMVPVWLLLRLPGAVTSPEAETR